LVESAELPLRDEEFEDTIPIYASAAICNNHGHKDGIDNPMSGKGARESPLVEKWNTAMKAEFDAISQHLAFGDIMERPAGR
jgi:hypothetical protein